MEIDYMEPVKFTGNEEVNTEFHHGMLMPAVGINTIQVIRCQRDNPEGIKELDWTYNHAPMLAYHNNKYYLEYLSNPIGEHVPPGRTLLLTSPDGINWSSPRIVFPIYPIPDGAFSYNGHKLPENSYAVMHQRMGFYKASNGKFLILGHYGICPTPHQVPFEQFGIGRVIREIHPDDTFGPVFFIRYNKGTVWNEENTNYPFYKHSPDEEFVKACDQILSDPLATQQWAEEQGDVDDIVTVKSRDGGPYYNKAFCWYRIEDDTIIGLWKWMKAAVSHDGGKSWSGAELTPSIKHAGAKIWGQKTSDQRYALVYNPHTDNSRRWPLGIITGNDGLVFDKMMCVDGDLPQRRYTGGNYKSFGFHYVRGIETDEAKSPDGAMYVVYSVNKEDIRISRIPVPVKDSVKDDIFEDFSDQKCGSWIEGWNIYSAKWAPVYITTQKDSNEKCLKLEDRDPYDYAKATRIFKQGTNITVDISIMAAQSDRGALYIEICDHMGRVAARVVFDKDKELKIRHGRKFIKYFEYEKDKWYDLRIEMDTIRNEFDVSINGTSLSRGQKYQNQATPMKGWFLTAPVKTADKIVFRTGPARHLPNSDTLSEDMPDVPDPDKQIEKVEYYIKRLEVKSR